MGGKVLQAEPFGQESLVKEDVATRVATTYSLAVTAFIRIVIMSPGAWSFFILCSDHPAKRASMLRLKKLHADIRVEQKHIDCNG